MNCRHCRSALGRPFLDLGHAPLSNGYLTEAGLQQPETTYPLRLCVCDQCRLVQATVIPLAKDIFQADYAYFSSTSRGWLQHAAAYSQMIIGRLGLGPQSLVVEVASNDGYLLRNFVAAGVPCLGIEPTEGTARAAIKLGIPVLQEFFGHDLGQSLADTGRSADLICGNNVYAHVPDINDFTQGLAAALKPEGVITLEFPHLLRLIEQCQFDTVYHEHFSYLTFAVTARIFAAAGLRVFDVEHLPTHGGSLRVYGCRAAASHAEQTSVAACLEIERKAGLDTSAPYDTLQARAEAIKDGLLTFLLEAKRAGRPVAGYGAAAKGNTLLNFAGVKRDLLPYVCDAAPSKQGLFMPGSHIPILAPEVLNERRPDYVLILPWNIADEVRTQLASLASRGTRFVTAVPELVIT